MMIVDSGIPQGNIVFGNPIQKTMCMNVHDSCPITSVEYQNCPPPSPKEGMAMASFVDLFCRTANDIGAHVLVFSLAGTCSNVVGLVLNRGYLATHLAKGRHCINIRDRGAGINLSWHWRC